MLRVSRTDSSTRYWEYYSSLQEKDNGESFGESEHKPGITVGAGIDYFVTRTATVKFEGRYDWVAVDDGRPNPSGISLTVGVKKFF